MTNSSYCQVSSVNSNGRAYMAPMVMTRQLIVFMCHPRGCHMPSTWMPHVKNEFSI